VRPGALAALQAFKLCIVNAEVVSNLVQYGCPDLFDQAGTAAPDGRLENRLTVQGDSIRNGQVVGRIPIRSGNTLVEAHQVLIRIEAQGDDPRRVGVLSHDDRHVFHAGAGVLRQSVKRQGDEVLKCAHGRSRIASAPRLTVALGALLARDGWAQGNLTKTAGGRDLRLLPCRRGQHRQDKASSHEDADHEIDNLELGHSQMLRAHSARLGNRRRNQGDHPHLTHAPAVS
jgi:hypothetical protein